VFFLLFVLSPFGGLDWHCRNAFGTLNLPGNIITISVLKSLWVPVECCVIWLALH
jgi:hypothetical protein